jgi:hypothetical protein
MERVEPPKGYVLKNKDEVREIMEVEAALLRSEGIDPRWPGFPQPTDEQDDSEDP